MTITTVRLFSYRLPFLKPATFLSPPMTHREGYIIEVIDSDGHFSQGECAPLPGYSIESLATAGSQLQRIAKWIKRFEIDMAAPLESARQLCEDDCPSSVLFAVESAFAMLAASSRSVPAAGIFNEDFSLDVPVNALIESADDVRSRLSQLSSHYCKAAKLKVGRQSVESDIELVNVVREGLAPNIALRLDANRRWTFEEAAQFASGVAGCDIEYIEEPTGDRRELPRLSAEFPNLPIALDESVRDLSIDDIREGDYFSVVVIKPTVIGGIARSFEIVRACKQTGKKPVLGAAIESSVGLSMIAQMASSLIDETPIGLDTSRLFAQDLAEPPLQVIDYTVNIEPDVTLPFRLNHDLLTEVPLV